MGGGMGKLKYNVNKHIQEILCKYAHYTDGSKDEKQGLHE